MQDTSFQNIILKLQQFWAEKNCVILQPADLEMGAGTFHQATILRSLTDNPWNVAYVQPSRRPTDGRYGMHPNRLQHYYQFQVILKPSPENIQDLYLESLAYLGVDIINNDIRFVEDDWASPTLGAAGLGWEVWCNGMEVSQFTYMQQIAGIDLKPVPGELTYGLERLALYIQQKDNVMDLVWNNGPKELQKTYGDIFKENERQYSEANFEHMNTDILFKQFVEAENQCQELINQNLPIPAYDYCIKASHLFNLLSARGVISVTERASYIARVRKLAKMSCELWFKQNQEN